MARISSYSQDENVQKTDKLIGSDGSGSTRNFSIDSISKFLRESNAAGVAGQFTFICTDETPTTGQIRGTHSSGTSLANLTSIKMSKYLYKHGSSAPAINTAMTVLNNRDVLIVDVNDHNNYGIYGAGTVTQDGSSDFYDLALNHKSSNGNLGNGNVYAVTLYAGRDLSYTHTQTSASDTWTINHNLGKFPSVSIKFSTGADFNNTGALGGVTYTNENTLTINLAAAESGVAYLN
tara:strand:- start:250 stop:954 length:705 start_codon:yes stop_codon:yes gene_type:complete